MAFTIAHLSDPHLPAELALNAGQYFSKRLLGLLNWRRRSATYSGAVLEKIIADMQAQAPDHVVVTGDLTNLGLPQEFENAKTWLSKLGGTENVTIVPGNHDAYVLGALEHGVDVLKPWMGGDAMTPALGFPFVKRHGSIAFVGVSSAIPTRPFSAAGRIGRRQLAALKDTLDILGREQMCRVVLVHHPIHTDRKHHFKRLLDADAFKDVLTMTGAELVLHGHLHRPMTNTLYGAYDIIPVLGVASAAADPRHARHAAGYALYRVEHKPDGWHLSITRRTLQLDNTFQKQSGSILVLAR